MSHGSNSNRYQQVYWHLLLAITLAVSLILTAAPSVSAQSTVHVVQRGDSLSVIAARYGISMSDLAAANGIGNSDYVWIGQQLTIPGVAGGGSNWSSASTGKIITVGRGDSLSLIAAIHGMTLQELMDLNGLTNANHVWVGQQLQVTGGSDATSQQTVSASSASQATNSNAINSNAIYHVVQSGESLSAIAAYHGVTQQSVMNANGLSDPNHVQLGQRLQIIGGHQPSVNSVYAPPAGRKRIVVDLSDQTLTAWHGESVALYTNISSGTWATPTITGYYKIDRKYSSQHMSGPGYSIPNVPWVMYFWQGYAFHGAYWHTNFGSPMSHGCIHLRPGEAEWLYSWASAGTDVFVNQ